jgi:hypothetical protein
LASPAVTWRGVAPTARASAIGGCASSTLAVVVNKRLVALTTRRIALARPWRGWQTWA